MTPVAVDVISLCNSETGGNRGMRAATPRSASARAAAEPKRAEAADVNRRTDEARVIDRIALQACLQGGDELVFQVGHADSSHDSARYRGR